MVVFHSSDATDRIQFRSADLTATNADGEFAIDLVEDDDNKTKQILDAEMQNLGINEESTQDELREKVREALLDRVDNMIAMKANLDLPDKRGATPLHAAASNGWADVAKLLIDNNASLECKDTDGDSPLHLAAFFEQQELVALLAKAGASIEAKNRFLETPEVMTNDATIQVCKTNITPSFDKGVREMSQRTLNDVILHLFAANI